MEPLTNLRCQIAVEEDVLAVGNGVIRASILAGCGGVGEHGGESGLKWKKIMNKFKERV